MHVPEPINEANVENRDDKFGDWATLEEATFIRTRSGCISRSHNHKTIFPGTAHFQ